MVRKVIEPEAEPVAAGAILETHDVAKEFQLFGLSVGGQPHDFVFVAKFQEAKILRDRAVKESQRMRKRNGPFDFHAAAAAGSPHSAGKITEAVSGEQRGAIERRTKKAAGQVRLVMLDAMEFRSDSPGMGVEGLRQRFRNALEFHQNFGALTRKGR